MSMRDRCARARSGVRAQLQPQALGEVARADAGRLEALQSARSAMDELLAVASTLRSSRRQPRRDLLERVC